jgi:AcrR family transcriptional regulator
MNRGYGGAMTSRPESKTASRYHSPLRARQAAETRRSIVAAALRLFGTRGWAATTLPMIAAEAGTSVDTIYASFGTKSNLMMAVVEVAIVGDDGEAAMVDRPEFTRFAEGTVAERIRTGIHYTVAVFERSVPILKALREAAASDVAARDRLTRYDQDRRDLTAAGLALILGAEPTDDVVDAVWALVSPEVFTHLTEGRGWSVEETESWLAEMGTAALGIPGRGQRSSRHVEVTPTGPGPVAP